MKKGKNILLFTLIVLFLAACTAGPNSMEDVVGPDGGMAGFWMGLWHGIIAPVTFVISLFTDKINMYEIHNTGNWYDFGFVLGAGIIFGGGASSRR